MFDIHYDGERIEVTIKVEEIVKNYLSLYPDAQITDRDVFILETLKTLKYHLTEEFLETALSDTLDIYGVVE